VSIERFDDVAFDAYGTPDEIIQTKHHPPCAGSLTDASVDLWKTIKIWADLVHGNIDLAFRVQFTLLTTGEAPEGSAASLLRVTHRNEEEAGRLLLRASGRYRNRETEPGRKAFNQLSEVERTALLNAIVVLDSSPSIVDVWDELCIVLAPAAPRGQVEHFVQRLEGWWFGVVIEALRRGNASIPLMQIDDKMDELREGFRRDNLPVDYEGVMVPPEHEQAYDQRPFVQQLQLINVGESRISYAIRDYYRAFEQRSRWIREELLFDPEIAKYELALMEQWEPRFAEQCDELGDDAPDDQKVRAGQSVFRWAERDANIPLRTVTNRFLCHGSYHMLADVHKIGWHPEYHIILGVDPVNAG
jgi:hypothetical protein